MSGPYVLDNLRLPEIVRLSSFGHSFEVDESLSLDPSRDGTALEKPTAKFRKEC